MRPGWGLASRPYAGHKLEIEAASCSAVHVVEVMDDVVQEVLREREHREL
jgi:hypothetical protein